MTHQNPNSIQWKKEFKDKELIAIKGVGFMVVNIGRRSITLRRVQPKAIREDSREEIKA